MMKYRVQLVIGGVLLTVLALQKFSRSRENDQPFEVPSAEVLTEAAGSTDSLSASERRAFDARSPSFTPLGGPGPHDWLANHREPGQTFLQFVRSRRNLPDAKRKVLYIYPLGSFEKEGGQAPPLEVLREYSALFFGMAARILPAKRDIAGLPVKSRIHPTTKRRQLLSTDILKYLPKVLPDDAFCMIAVTMEDLYPEESWNFVFGQASLRNRVGVFSFARYDPAFYGEKRSPESRQRVLERSCKVLVHETGHMFGIAHCIHFNCIMNGSNHLEETDSRPMHLCPVCLRKMANSAKFDPAERYRKLAAFYKANGFADESAWAKQRADVIGAE